MLGSKRVIISSDGHNLFSFFSLCTDTAESLSEGGVGSVILSDGSSQQTLAFSSEQTMNTQQAPNHSQPENSAQGQVYPSQQLMGHYQSIPGVRGHCFLLKPVNS